mgnify:CR=1 FL=1
MSAEEYLKPYDEAYEAMHEVAIQANNTQTLTPPMLYGVLGNLRGTAASLSEILPSAARAARAGAAGLDLYDAEGNDPDEQLALTLRTLEDATGIAQQLLALLDTAQSGIASVGYRD